jgi:hypothetical protein
MVCSNLDAFPSAEERRSRRPLVWRHYTYFFVLAQMRNSGRSNRVLYRRQGALPQSRQVNAYRHEEVRRLSAFNDVVASVDRAPAGPRFHSCSTIFPAARGPPRGKGRCFREHETAPLQMHWGNAQAAWRTDGPADGTLADRSSEFGATSCSQLQARCPASSRCQRQNSLERAAARSGGKRGSVAGNVLSQAVRATVRRSVRTTRFMAMLPTFRSVLPAMPSNIVRQPVGEM